MLKGLKYIKCRSLSSPRPNKSSSNSIRNDSWKITVDEEDLKPYWQSEQKTTFLDVIKGIVFTSFSKILLTTEGRLTGW